MITLCLAIAIALAADHFLGEPPLRWHPLVWLGDAADRVEAALRNESDSTTWQLKLGAFAVGAVVLIAMLPFLLLGAVLPEFALTVVALTLAIGRRSLVEHATAIATPLAVGDLERARTALGHIVSRDTDALDEADVSRATVESVLENGADAVFAALFWTVVLGPLGAVLYRTVNTLDAMWGYRNARYTHFGCAAARLDDLLNWLPARLTAATYTALGASGSAWQAWQTHRWYSGNAGAVMASGAGALEIELGGDAHYDGEIKSRPRLGSGRAPEVRDIERACSLVNRGVAVWMMALSCAALGTLL